MAMIEKIQHPEVFSVDTGGKDEVALSDIVFAANAGVCLPRLPETVVLLPSMKYAHRKLELPYLRAIFRELKLRTIEFPKDPKAPFEGQAELKWFAGGTKAICGYGHRSTKQTFTILQRLLRDIYASYGLPPPNMLPVHLQSDAFYHLDLAMLEFDDTQCIVQKGAFSPKTTRAIQDFLGASNVHILETKDPFCLNAIVDGPHLLTHTLQEKGLKKILETVTGRTVVETNMSEFELSGGSVRCMSMDVF
jgi:N-dimethylarginine dimethylaminohydrolase